MTDGPERYQARVKEYVLIAILFCAAFFVGYFWHAVGFTDRGVSGVYGEAASLFALTISFALFSLGYSRSGAVWLVAVVSSLLLFISYPFTNLYSIGIVIGIACFSWGAFRIRWDADNHVRLQWHSVLERGLGIYFTGLGLMFSLLYFALSIPSGGIEQAAIPKPIFYAVVPVLQGPLQGLIPGFTADSTVRQVILQAIEDQSRGEIRVNRLPRAEVDRFVADQLRELNTQLGTKFNGSEKVSDALYEVISKKLNEYAAPYKRYLPALITAGYFLSIRFVFYLFSWMIVIVFPLLMFSLIRAGVFQRTADAVQKERVSFS